MIDPELTGGVIYEQWTDGHAVGFKITHPSGQVGYVYLNPSTNDDPAEADVFLYSGPAGTPESDEPVCFVIPFGTARRLRNACEACNAEPDQECAPDCIGLQSILDGIEDATNAT